MFLNQHAKSIRTFIGAKNFQVSSQFYKDLGFQEHLVAPNMSYFSLGNLGFYLQDAYVKKWINNSMIFLEVDDPQSTHDWLNNTGVVSKYKGVKLSNVVINDWGNECFLHDPSGVLWHFGAFKS